jgi:DNA excision repair protein ERCC-5
MGVNGLWTVVQPCARPTNLGTLNRKRLAVDASIWIYQFLKAVRDKEGNALRNSHVVGFFRRICKLLWFGIRPVFVFDGGAPALKRQTITGRKRRREGRREDAVRTAGKLLAVQMQRIAEEEEDKRHRQSEMEKDGAARIQVEEPVEQLPDADSFVYVDELGMNQQERQKNRKFYKQDAYHLPELPTTIQGMGNPDDPRIMSVEELEEYARQFENGEDINMYDFSKIDFEGEFFNSLPQADRYHILNAARIRSRLRMGLSKEQLEDMFPDRMAFSRFQIERVKERNHLTQRLMKEAGMTGTDLTLNGSARIAGEKDREYILVKNEGAEGGWALGVVSKEKDQGEMHKPIDVDALDFKYQTKEEDEEPDDDEEWENVPVARVDQLPKLTPQALRDAVEGRQPLSSAFLEDEDDDSLFVQDSSAAVDALFGSQKDDELQGDEEEDINRAIALSLKNQHDVELPSRGGQDEDEDEDLDFEDVPAPEWKQRVVEQPRPVTSSSGGMIAHIVNKRASAAVPKRRRSDASNDGDLDLGSALSAARKKQKPAPTKTQAAPVFANKKNPFDGPLPFEKLKWTSSIFAKKPKEPKSKPTQTNIGAVDVSEGDDAGGFEKDQTDEEEARPLPPWMEHKETDIREDVKELHEEQKEIDEADREAALEEEKRLRKEAIIEIESSDEDDDDVEIIDAPPPNVQHKPSPPRQIPLSPATLTKISPPIPDTNVLRDNLIPISTIHEKTTNESTSAGVQSVPLENEEPRPKPPSPEPAFVDVGLSQLSTVVAAKSASKSPEPVFEDVPAASTSIVDSELIAPDQNGDLFVGEDGDMEGEYSDPEDEELFAQMAEEAEEHARFASELNNRSERENQEAYERELKALRTQQKKDRRDADEVTQIMITECQALLRFFGIPYITAPMEAEAQCAELVRLGLVDGIVTDDSDTFLFGGTRIYKNMFNGNKFVECYLASDLEKELSLSREQLISLAQLLGSDYTEGLPGVGPVSAVEILSDFPGADGLESFRDWWQDVQIHNRPKDADAGFKFRQKFRKSQGTKLFLPLGFPNPAVHDAYLHPEVDSTPEPFQWGMPDVDGLRRFLMATIGWSQERTDEVLVPVIKDMNRREVEGTQSNITRFFEGGVGVGAKEAFAPRQKVHGSKRMTEAVNKLRANAVVDSLAGHAGESGESSGVASNRARGKRRARNAPVVDDDDDEDFVEDNVHDGQAGGGVQETGDAKKKGRGKGRKKARPSE